MNLQTRIHKHINSQLIISRAIKSILKAFKHSRISTREIQKNPIRNQKYPAIQEQLIECYQRVNIEVNSLLAKSEVYFEDLTCLSVQELKHLEASER